MAVIGHCELNKDFTIFAGDSKISQAWRYLELVVESLYPGDDVVESIPPDGGIEAEWHRVFVYSAHLRV